MTAKAKLLAKLMGGMHDRSFTFEEARQVLMQAGFIFDGGKGSHKVYRHPDGRRMVLPCHGKDVKPPYVRQIRDLLKP